MSEPRIEYENEAFWTLVLDGGKSEVDRYEFGTIQVFANIANSISFCIDGEQDNDPQASTYGHAFVTLTPQEAMTLAKQLLSEAGKALGRK